MSNKVVISSTNSCDSLDLSRHDLKDLGMLEDPVVSEYIIIRKCGNIDHIATDVVDGICKVYLVGNEESTLCQRKALFHILKVLMWQYGLDVEDLSQCPKHNGNVELLRTRASLVFTNSDFSRDIKIGSYVRLFNKEL